MSDIQPAASGWSWRVLTRRDAIAGLMFIAVAVFGLWASWNYRIGTALNMSTGYVPRLLCWLLLALGVVILVLGLRARDERGAFAGAEH